MTIEKQLQELAQQTCPKQVDVVDAVMAEVRQRPYLQPASHAPYAWLRSCRSSCHSHHQY